MNNLYVNDFTSTVRIYYDDLRKYKPLTKIKEKKLLKLSKKGNIKAKNELLEANLKFVFDIAKNYTGRGVPISELISEGNMGLLKAIEKFDASKDVKFISYAVWWIRQSMLECIKKNKLLSLVELDPIETNDSLFDKKISEDDDEIVNNNNPILSNESEENSKELSRLRKDVVNKLLTCLNNREKNIIEDYYGLNDKMELTLNDIGKKYSLSSERVRQIKKQGLKKLRSKMLLLDEIEDFSS